MTRKRFELLPGWILGAEYTDVNGVNKRVTNIDVLHGLVMFDDGSVLKVEAPKRTKEELTEFLEGVNKELEIELKKIQDKR